MHFFFARYPVIFSAMLCCTLFSCRKDDKSDCEPTTNSENQLIAGDENCVKVTQLNHTIKSIAGLELRYNISIDDDTIPDIQFYLLEQSTYHFRIARLIALTNSVLLGGQLGTKYHYQDTLYSSTNPVKKDIIDGYVCTEPTGAPYIDSYTVQNSRYVPYNHAIQTTDSWAQGSIEIFGDETQSIPTYIHTTPDTVTTKLMIVDHTCNNIELGKGTYIPLMHTVDGKQKLGWVSLLMPDAGTLIIGKLAMQY